MSRQRKIRKLAFKIAEQLGFEILEKSKDKPQGAIAYIDPKEPYKIRFVDKIKNNFDLIVVLHEMGHTLEKHYEIHLPTAEELNKLFIEEDKEGWKDFVRQKINCEEKAWLYGFRLFHRLCPDIVLSEKEILECMDSLATQIDRDTGGLSEHEEIIDMTTICFREIFQHVKQDYPYLEQTFDHIIERLLTKKEGSKKTRA